MRRTVPLAIAFISGVILLFQYFNPSLYGVYEMALEWLPIISGIVAFLGIASFAMHHWFKVKKKSQDWRFSVAALIAFAAMVIAGFWGEFFGASVPDVAPAFPEVATVDLPDDAGGQIALKWKLDNLTGDVATFEVYRKAAEAGDDAFVKIAERPAQGKPVPNRETHGKPLPNLVENGDFEKGPEGFAQLDGARREENPYKGGFVVLPAGAAIETPGYEVDATGRYEVKLIARSPSTAGRVKIDVLGSGADPLKTYEMEFENDEWVNVVPGDLESHFLPPEGEATVRLRIKAEDAEVSVDDLIFRPVVVEFVNQVVDACAFNDDADYPHFGEVGDSLLTKSNPTFDVNLGKWTGETAERVVRTDMIGKFCARVPGGGTLMSERLDRPKDPISERYSFRWRGWGGGGEAGLKAEIVAFEPNEVGAAAGTMTDGLATFKETEITLAPAAGARFLRVRISGAGDVDAVSVRPFIEGEEEPRNVMLAAVFDGSLAPFEESETATVESEELTTTDDTGQEVKEQNGFARLSANGSLLSGYLELPEEPEEGLAYRLKFFWRGAQGGLKVELVAFDEKEAGAAAGEWAAGTDWEMKEIEFTDVPETTTSLRMRFTAVGAGGFAEVDDMLLFPVKVHPVAGADYVYKVVAMSAEAAPLIEFVSEPISGDHEVIGSWKSPYGVYRWLFLYILVPMEATMFALLAFFIASAAFRAFRARSLEAALLLVAAIFVMIGRVPVGDFIWEPLGDIADWIMMYPNGAAKRAIMIGVGLGMAATSLKLMLGIERAYLGKG